MKALSKINKISLLFGLAIGLSFRVGYLVHIPEELTLVQLNYEQVKEYLFLECCLNVTYTDNLDYPEVFFQYNQSQEILTLYTKIGFFISITIYMFKENYFFKIHKTISSQPQNYDKQYMFLHTEYTFYNILQQELRINITFWEIV